MANIQITQELVRELFTYNNGVLYWRINASTRARIGYSAGYLKDTNSGFRYLVGVNKRYYFRSRLIFLYHKGYMPIVVDHENHITTDDRIENLRAASKGDNCKNCTSHKDSTSKYLGISYQPKKDRWKVRISINGKNTHISQHKSEIDAALSYNRAAVKYHKEFANLNIIRI